MSHQLHLRCSKSQVQQVLPEPVRQGPELDRAPLVQQLLPLPVLPLPELRLQLRLDWLEDLQRLAEAC